jgi:hypothetical protein
MKSLQSHIREALLHEERFMKLDFLSSNDSGLDYEQLIGFVDIDTVLKLCAYTSGDKAGKRWLEVNSGKKYLSNSNKPGFSKKYADDEIPAKWANHWDELSNEYDKILVSTAEVTESAVDWNQVKEWFVAYYFDSDQTHTEILSGSLKDVRLKALKQLKVNARYIKRPDEVVWASFTDNAERSINPTKTLDVFDARIKMNAKGQVVNTKNSF